MVEPDPENPLHLFVITEDQIVHKIKDIGDGKARVDGTIDLTHHELEMKL